MFGRLRGARVLHSEAEYRKAEAEKLFETAQSKRETGDYESALADCNAGLSLDPMHYSLRDTQAYVLFMLKDYKKTQDALLIAAHQEPQDRGIPYNLGVTYGYLALEAEEKGNLVEAFKMYEESCKNFEECHHLDVDEKEKENLAVGSESFLKVSYHREKGEALLFIDMAIRVNPGNELAYYSQGSIYFQLAEEAEKEGRTADAREMYEDSLQSYEMSFTLSLENSLSTELADDNIPNSIIATRNSISNDFLNKSKNSNLDDAQKLFFIEAAIRLNPDNRTANLMKIEKILAQQENQGIVEICEATPENMDEALSLEIDNTNTRSYRR